MKSRALIIGTILSLVIAIMIPGVAAAKGGKPSQDDPPDASRLLYGDLFVLERDGAGIPVTRDITYEDPHTYESVTVACLQPLASDCGLLPLWGECGLAGLPDGVLPLPPECTFNPEDHDACEVFSIEEDEFYDYASEIQEVSFGRGSVTRSQAFVIDSRYGEFLEMINDATDLRLDPAGRVQMELPNEDEDPDDLDDNFYWKTVDAPLENLGMYRATMSYGCFNFVEKEITGEEGERVMQTFALDPSAITLLRDNPVFELDHLVCDYVEEPAGDVWLKEKCWVEPEPEEGPEPTPCWWEDHSNFILPDRTLSTYEPGEGVEPEDMDSATAFLAAATDKGDPMSLDEMITINTYIGINPWISIGSKKDQTLEIKYFPFATGGDEQFTYDRSTTFPTSTIARLLVNETMEGEEDSMDFYAFDLPLFFDSGSSLLYDCVDLSKVNLKVCRGGDAVNENVVDDEVVVDACDGSFDETFCGGANWFAQATEHARRTVWYLHNWEVPELGN